MHAKESRKFRLACRKRKSLHLDTSPIGLHHNYNYDRNAGHFSLYAFSRLAVVFTAAAFWHFSCWFCSFLLGMAHSLHLMNTNRQKFVQVATLLATNKWTEKSNGPQGLCSERNTAKISTVFFFQNCRMPLTMIEWKIGSNFKRPWNIQTNSIW